MFKYLILQKNCVHLEVVVSNQTELGAGGKVVEQLCCDSISWVSENFLHLILISSTYFAWSSSEFRFVKNLWKNCRWKFF